MSYPMFTQPTYDKPSPSHVNESFTTPLECGGRILRDFYEDGQISQERWLNSHSIFHRDEDQPAHLMWYPNGNLMSMAYYEKGTKHRDPKEGAAHVEFGVEGDMRYESYLIKGFNGCNRHREDGPAIVDYLSLKQLTLRFFLNDVEYTFWGFYNQASSDVRVTLLRDWFHLLK